MKEAEERIRRMAGRVSEAHGFELEDLRLLRAGRRMLLRVVIDKPGGVTLDDCRKMSRDLEGLLDLEDPIKGPYTLEVSSPGLDRPLRKPEDFKKHIGKLARVTTRHKVEAGNFFVGRLISVDDKGVRLQVLRGGSQPLGDGQIEIAFDNIASARLEIEV